MPLKPLTKPFVITIDGPAASGKSSASRHLSKTLGCPWVSTGAFYRAIGLIADMEQVNLENEAEVVGLIEKKEWEVKLTPEKTRVIYKNEDITDSVFLEKTGKLASVVSQLPEVRKALLQAQRDLSCENQGLIAEGRDCGTVVFPNADVKFFLTANSESRAERRALQEGGDIQKIHSEQKLRDERDKSRQSAPMQVPEGAHVLDTSQLNLEEVVQEVEKIVLQTLDLS